MFTKLERKIAFRYLAAKRRGFGSVVSWVSLIGIMLGVATLIVVMSVMGGFHDTLLSRIVGMNEHLFLWNRLAEFIETVCPSFESGWSRLGISKGEQNNKKC